MLSFTTYFIEKLRDQLGYGLQSLDPNAVRHAIYLFQFISETVRDPSGA